MYERKFGFILFIVSIVLFAMRYEVAAIYFAIAAVWFRNEGKQIVHDVQAIHVHYENGRTHD